MKKYIALVIIAFIFGCTSDNDLIDINNIDAPTNVSALFTIKQDNSGLVTITPSGDGVTQYEVFYSDASNESDVLNPGGTTSHVYLEGVYPVKIIATTLNGLQTEIIKELTVSFIAPENLVAIITPVTGNNMAIKVSATADLETYFQVFYGEDPAQVPVDFMQGDEVTHTYTNVGIYEVRVVALTGGIAFAEDIQQVIISNPILLPINFESSTLNYAFVNFGGASTTVVDNPYMNVDNTSSKVAKLNKGNGSEVWAGSFIELGSPIDFSTLQKIKIKCYAPAAGKIIRMKLENSANANVFLELDATTTVANAWEELVFDFTGAVSSNNYQKIVIFYDFGNAGTNSDYYYDDVELTSGAPTVELPLDFESSVLTYTFTNFGGAGVSIIANPDASGINTSANVAHMNKGNGSQTWAGSFIELDAPIDFSSLQKIKIKSWAPAAGKIIRMKLENSTNPNVFLEVDATTVTANGWEELTFDFTGVNSANNYQKVVLFYDFGNAGTGADYYFDDIIQFN
ncbi:hypothetical protein [uncultured Flavobacterium sp.]|jgi:hypothetical protein|uniref:hypothetical protein n=1 Tax=uncultured Flavobacterium sp. TaxID=165435 RepID=UPI0030CA2112